jgi:hypothetical protein
VKVTIITVAYNSAATIADTLASIEAQTHVDIEHIVIDGGSRDATMELVRRHGTRVAHIVSEPDGGIYDAMNKGLALATGELVGFLNADDVLDGSHATHRIVKAASLCTAILCMFAPTILGASCAAGALVLTGAGDCGSDGCPHIRRSTCIVRCCATWAGLTPASASRRTTTSCCAASPGQELRSPTYPTYSCA